MEHLGGIWGIGCKTLCLANGQNTYAGDFPELGFVRCYIAVLYYRSYTGYFVSHKEPLDLGNSCIRNNGRYGRYNYYIHLRADSSKGEVRLYSIPPASETADFELDQAHRTNLWLRAPDVKLQMKKERPNLFPA